MLHESNVPKPKEKSEDEEDDFEDGEAEAPAGLVVEEGNVPQAQVEESVDFSVHEADEDEKPKTKKASPPPVKKASPAPAKKASPA